MNFLEKLRDTADERPRRFAVSVFLVFFWISGPLLAQAFFNMSAVHVSFAITVIYYVAWKVYERFY